MTVDDLFAPTIDINQIKEESVGVIVTTSFDSGVTVTTSSNKNSAGKTFYATSVKNGMFDGETQDYKTREEALSGHTKWVEHASKPIPIEIEELVEVLSKAENNGNLYRLAAHIILHGYAKVPSKVNVR
jgi:hypothetical protein